MQLLLQQIVLKMYEMHIHFCKLVIRFFSEQSLQQFYRTNWVKCLDWLKRIRFDMFENAMTVGNYELAFYQATISENKSLAELALFHLQGFDIYIFFLIWSYFNLIFRQVTEF